MNYILFQAAIRIFMLQYFRFFSVVENKYDDYVIRQCDVTASCHLHCC